MNRGAWWAIVHGVEKETDTTERLNSAVVQSHSRRQRAFVFQAAALAHGSVRELCTPVCARSLLLHCHASWAPSFIGSRGRVP